ncbi:MAG: hypothetical protein ABSF26_20905 [Thermoguttaceae bacterium]
MICRCGKWDRGTWLGLGLAGGMFLAVLVFAGLWPNTPLHAVATDKIDTFGIATGPVDEFCEAIYFLDYLTGDLKAVVIGRMRNAATGWGVQGFYARNVMADLNVDATKNPRFVMVTGTADLMRGGRGGAIQPSRSVLYVAEVTTGGAAAYAIPWNPNAHVQMQYVEAPLVLIVKFPFRRAPAPSGKTKSGKDAE